MSVTVRSLAPALLMLLVPAVAGAQASPQLVDRVVAVVDEEPILLSDLEREIESYHFEAQSAGRTVEEDPAEVRRKMLDRLVEIKLLVAQAKLDGITIAEEELEQAVARDLDGIIGRFGTKAKLEEELGRMGMTFGDLQDRHRELNRNRIYTARIVRRHIHPRIDIREEEVDAFYRENQGALPATPDTLRLANVLIVPQYDPDLRARVETWVDDVGEALDAGRPFEEVAREFSEGPNAARGGLVGEDFGRGDLFSPLLEDIAWRLPLGEVSRPIQTELGVHLVRVTERDDNALTLYQIMIRAALTAENHEEARRAAAAVAERARQGQDFGQLAAQVSDDPATRERGGDLGWFPLDRLNPQFVEAVAQLPEGAVTDPLRGAAGYFVLKVTGRKEGQRASLEEVRERLREVLFQQRVDEEMQDFLQDLRERFHIDFKA